MNDQQPEKVPVHVALASIGAALDAVDPDRSMLGPQARLRVVTTARSLAGRLEALAGVLLAEANAANASERAVATPLGSWLAIDQNMTRREAAGMIHRADGLAGHPQVAEAAMAGAVSTTQVRAITNLLDGLAPQLDQNQQTRAESLLVDLAKTLDSEALAKAAPRVLAEVSPVDANELLETKLQREAEAAYRSRSLRLWRQAGSVRFEGSLPRLVGEQLITLLDAHSEALRRTAVEARDPLWSEATTDQRRADALAALLKFAAGAKPAPGVGGARVIVKLDYDQLRSAGAGLVGEDSQLSAGELRRACCDAELIPVVLRGGSEVLDVGRTQRLVSAPLRNGLVARDGGCVFPTCAAPPSASEAHHIQPWWAGGETTLANLVLLCHHHHGLCEPARYGLRDQWQVRIGEDQLPEFTPPSRHPQAGQWLQHHRHQQHERIPA